MLHRTIRDSFLYLMTRSEERSLIDSANYLTFLLYQLGEGNDAQPILRGICPRSRSERLRKETAATGDWTFSRRLPGTDEYNRKQKRTLKNMAHEGDLEIVFGTREPPSFIRQVTLGPMQFEIIDGAIRRIRWRGVEVVRGIAVPIRDEKWGTLPTEIIEETISSGDSSDSFQMTQVFRCASGALTGRLTVNADSGGNLDAHLELAADPPFMTNRAGFAVLHPIAGVAGSPLAVTHADGSVERTRFPDTISPGQPAFDTVALAYEPPGAQVDISFSGEVFEMEDQRNWSDASFKTYCRPLALPFPYPIDARSPVRQSVRIRLRDAARGKTAPRSAETSSPNNSETSISPDILLAVEPAWINETPDAVSGYLVRFDPARPWGRRSLSMLQSKLDAAGAYADFEIIAPPETPLEKTLENVATLTEEAGLSPGHVVAIPAPYMNSFQPDGPWPDGPTPDDCAAAVERFFPAARAGAGVLTNFTELNRRRPAPGAGAYLTHGNAAIVHAADDTSVFETLEGLAEIFRCGRLIACARAYRIGLVSIGMRTNPYGGTLDENEARLRRTMTADDPRQDGLFAAAYAIGAAGEALRAGAQAVALAAPAGPFGYRRSDGGARPLFHALKALARVASRRAAPASDQPSGVVGIEGEDFSILANCSLEPVHVDVKSNTAVLLDVNAVRTGAEHDEWLNRARPLLRGTVTLAPCACLFDIAQE